jgi:hypothetical protein
MLSYEQRRDQLLAFIRKQNMLWDRNIESEEKARKPLKPKKPTAKVELLNQIPRKRY